MSTKTPTKQDYVSALTKSNKCVRVTGSRKQLMARVQNLKNTAHRTRASRSSRAKSQSQKAVKAQLANAAKSVVVAKQKKVQVAKKLAKLQKQLAY